MKTTKTLFTILILLQCITAFSQVGNEKRTYHWYFGDYAGLDFSSGEPVEDTLGQMMVYAGCAAISDTAGNLLMYTDGILDVWNKNHQVMENGDNFNVASYPGTPWQSSVIVPKPGSDDIYYIFYIQSEMGKNWGGFYYAIVDMSYNNGEGKVLEKGIPLFTTHSEAIGAVHHRNGEDVWIMGHESETNNFWAFLLTKFGITDTVITTIGNFAETPYGAYGLKFSPNGKKMACSAFWDNLNNPTFLDTLHLFDFNNQTGSLLNTVLLPDTSVGSFIFSPSNNMLYVCNYNTNVVPYPANIVQYDISSNNEAIILSTMNIVYIPTIAEYPDFQITPDNKIIAARTFEDELAIINNPNEYGIACDVNDEAIPLTRTCYTTLPNFISSYFNSDTTAYTPISVNQILKRQKYNAYPNPFIIETIINTENKQIEQYNLFDSKGSVVSKNNYKLNRSDNAYVLTNKNMKGGLYFFNGTFSDSEVFSIQLIIN